MIGPRVYADFHNSDAQGRLRLNCAGTLEDLAEQHVELCEGMRLALYSDDLNEDGESDELLVEGVVSYSASEHCWVASIDWSAIRHASEWNMEDSTPKSQPTAGALAKQGRV